jgi:hypothetical protein
MDAEIRATSPEELKAKLGADLEAIGHDPALVTSAEWYERNQLWCFLLAATSTDLLEYPLAITHTSKSNPDFKLVLPRSAIGIEATRVTTEPYEHLSALHGKGETPQVISISQTLVANKRLPSAELVEKAWPFADYERLPYAELVEKARPFSDWDRTSNETRFWLQQAQQVVDRKTEIRHRDDYHDYGENWLLLWDKLSPVFSPLVFQNRWAALSGILSRRSYWTGDRVFNKIILECSQFRNFAVLDQQGTRPLAL